LTAVAKTIFLSTLLHVIDCLYVTVLVTGATTVGVMGVWTPQKLRLGCPTPQFLFAL